MYVLLIRVGFAPLVVLLVSVTARRAGPRWSGRLLGIPVTTGPFVLLACLFYGTAAAAGAARGAVAGQLGVACFCLGYGRLAPRLRPSLALPFALAVAAAADAFAMASRGGWPTIGLDLAVVTAGLATWPAPGTTRQPGPGQRVPTVRPGRLWAGLPARMAMAGTLSLSALVAARAAGPFAGGTLSALPVLLTIMGPAVHRTSSAQAAAEMMHQALRASYAAVGFLVVLSVALMPLGAPVAFLLALAVLAGISYFTRLGMTTPGGIMARWKARMSEPGFAAVSVPRSPSVSPGRRTRRGGD